MKILSAYIVETDNHYQIEALLENGEQATVLTVSKLLSGAELIANEFCNQLCLIFKLMR